jgi:hypothetical protein
MHKYLFTLILSFFLVVNSNAQQVYKGLGTSNSTFLFGYTSYAAKSQCIFLPANLNNLRSGNITRLYWRYGSTGNTNPQTLTYFTIKLGQTTATAYNANTFFTGLQQVMFDSSYTIPAGITGNWFAIDLDTTFAYDSTRTLIVQLTFPQSAVDNWGTYGTTNTPTRKIISPDTAAVTGDPSSGTWQDFGFDLLTPTGVQTIFNTANAFDFIVSPNPVRDQLHVIPLAAGNENLSITITNSLGQQVMNKTIASAEQDIDVSFLSRGVYTVTLSGKKQAEKSKTIMVE